MEQNRCREFRAPLPSSPHLTLLILGMMGCLAPVGVLAAPQSPVLTEQAGTQLEQALSHLPDGLTLADAQIQGDHVDVQCCAPTGVCARLTLTHLGRACAGDATPAFCVRFHGAAPTFRRPLLAALAGIPPTIWQETQLREVVAVPPQLRVWLQLGLLATLLGLLWLTSRGWRGAVLAASIVLAASVAWWQAMRADGRTWPIRREWEGLGWEAVWWLVPMLMGLLFGRLIRRRPNWRLAILLAPAAIGLLPLVWPSLLLGDAVPMACIAVWVTLWHSDARPHRGRRWGLSLAALGLALGGLEVGLRLLTPVPTTVEDSRSLLLRPAPMLSYAGTHAAWTEALFAEPGQFQILRAQLPQQPWILHLGDSMLYGAGIAATEAVPARMSQLQPTFKAVNGGIPGSTVDLQYLFLNRLLHAWPAPAAVVLHVFPDNDLDGLDLPIDVCGGHAVLEPASVQAACPTPQPETFQQRLRHTPLPLPITRAAQWSWLARRVVVAHDVLRWQDSTTDSAAAGRRYAQIASSLQGALQHRNIPLLVVLMPSRSGHYVDDGAASQMLSAIFAQLNVSVLDARSVFAERVRAGQEARLYLSGNDPHFSSEGAASYAAFVAPWLERQLQRP